MINLSLRIILATGLAVFLSNIELSHAQGIFKSGQPAAAEEKKQKKGFLRRAVTQGASAITSTNTGLEQVNQTAEKTKKGPFSKLRKKSDEVISPYDGPTFDNVPAVDTPTVADVPAVTAPNVDQPQASLPTTQKDSKFSLPKLSMPKLGKKKSKDVPIDTTGGEVLVNENGALVSSNGQSANNDYKVANTSPSSSTAASGQPPRVEDGSVVYQSWGDVKSYKNNAADQIIGEMRAQEAAHARKVAAAKADYNRRLKKAEEDARINRMLQGAINSQ